jgi:hypothetical protein
LLHIATQPALLATAIAAIHIKDFMHRRKALTIPFCPSQNIAIRSVRTAIPAVPAFFSESPAFERSFSIPSLWALEMASWNYCHRLRNRSGAGIRQREGFEK